MFSRKLTFAAIAIAGSLVLGAAGACAGTIPDPLHGICNGTSPTGTCNDNGVNTPLGNSSQFGFFMSPGTKTGTTGTFYLDILVPNNDSLPAGGFGVTGINGYCGNASCGTASLFSSTAWTSGDLAVYLSRAASPSNSIGAFLPTTQFYDPGATGFFIFDLKILNVTLFDQADQKMMFDMISGLGSDLGAYILGFFNTGTDAAPACPSGPKGDMCATANSGALLVDGGLPPGPPFVPEPSSLAIMGSALALLGLSLGRRARKQRATR